jgi:hypothetical protein
MSKILGAIIYHALIVAPFMIGCVFYDCFVAKRVKMRIDGKVQKPSKLT